MASANLCCRPLDVILTCRAADLPILQLTLQRLRRFVPLRRAHVITASTNLAKFRRRLGSDVDFHDEDALIPEMTLSRLKQAPLPGFPKSAGWYFQQLLKFAFAFQNSREDYFLIWDADTVPLRPLEFFDESGRMLFTIADEWHEGYFNTYRKLLRQEPRREFSFISQHMIVQRSILCEMLTKIDKNFPGEESWAWKIINNLEVRRTPVQRVRDARPLCEEQLSRTRGLSKTELVTRRISPDSRPAVSRRFGKTERTIFLCDL